MHVCNNVIRYNHSLLLEPKWTLMTVHLPRQKDAVLPSQSDVSCSVRHHLRCYRQSSLHTVFTVALSVLR